jgi:pimeloyl-ACP methyl ester carboxylesterase
MTRSKQYNFLLAATFSMVFTACTSMKEGAGKEPLVIQEQGSFAVGGTVVTAPGTFDPIAHGAFNPANQASEGQTLHGDHAYVFYQIPQKANKLPLVFWHGFGQSAKTWETTPDGREGFQTLFLRRHYPVYLIDQPRRGKAGRSTEPISISAKPDDQLWFGIFRMGVGSEFFPGVQFSKDPEALNQFFRHITPDTGPLNIDVNIAAVSALFDKIGPGVLITHSHSGGQGWLAAMKNSNIRAIASYEPGSNFVFPEGEVPQPIPYVGGQLSARGVPMEEFRALTKIPIIIYYGDYIPEEPVEDPGREQWRAAHAMAKQWRDVVNKHGGDVSLVYLPDAGLKGNTHFPMSDLNNEAVADLLAEWLKEKGLDQ